MAEQGQILKKSFSFSKSARKHELETVLIEAALRLPLSDKSHYLYRVERDAQKALGLSKRSPFITIRRLRMLDRQPGAIQQVYLSPARFKRNFLKRHDFQSESLIDVYEANGYRLVSRDTVLGARFANLYEVNLLSKYSPGLITRAVLDAEQQLFAQEAPEGSQFVLEYLKATYLENWRYEIKNRPAEGS